MQDSGSQRTERHRPVRLSSISVTALIVVAMAGVVIPAAPVLAVEPPGVSINQAVGQADPTSAGPIHFTVVFDEPVSGFETGDVGLSGTAGATTAVVTETTPGTTYDVAVSGMTSGGTVVAVVSAGVATDVDGNGNTASSTIDNTVTFVSTPPGVSINQAVGQADPTSAGPIHFTVVFDEPVSGFETGAWGCREPRGRRPRWSPRPRRVRPMTWRSAG